MNMDSKLFLEEIRLYEGGLTSSRHPREDDSTRKASEFRCSSAVTYQSFSHHGPKIFMYQSFEWFCQNRPKIEYQAVIKYTIRNTPTQIEDELVSVFGDSAAAEFKRGWGAWVTMKVLDVQKLQLPTKNSP